MSVRDSEYLASLLRDAARTAETTEPELTSWLYHNGYVKRHSGHEAATEPIERQGDSITAALMKANRGCPFMDSGWTVEGILNGGSMIARKSSARRRFAPGEYLTQRGPGVLPVPGDSVLVHAAVESRPSPGDAFYFSFGETVSPFDRNQELIRLYWNVSAEGAPPLLTSITGELNRFQIPFSFKCLHRASEYYRLDSAVLYIHRHYWPITSRLLPGIHRGNAAMLGGDGPLLTKPLAPGLHLAEDPGGGASFGMHRCTMLARAVRELRQRLDADPIEEARRQFAKAGFDIRTPYLNPGGRDLYELL
jgi:hypothetical protein